MICYSCLQNASCHTNTKENKDLTFLTWVVSWYSIFQSEEKKKNQLVLSVFQDGIKILLSNHGVGKPVYSPKPPPKMVDQKW